MAVLEIRYEGDPVLRQKATKLHKVDESVRKLADEMWETMLDANGVGLAAPQIGLSRRLIVVHVPEDYDEEGDPEYSFRLANPEIIKRYGEKTGLEGCLSIPGWVGEVPRAESVTVKAIDMDNRPIRIKATGQLAVVLQHEIDHLDGILYTDRVIDKSTLRKVSEEEYEEVAED
ncbi:MAG TPA: peptide deformylase [Thermomicrobiales bacterium]|nr:peptide deformylase [Thermomicrobiales bacterium]